MALEKTLTLTDLTLFGVASIMGSGGFNLIGTAVKSGGKWWIVACGIAALLLLGASHTYSRSIAHINHENTVESDIVSSIFGPYVEMFSITGILAFNIVSISVILVFCSHVIFPNSSWITQILFSFIILAGMILFALQGIDMNRDVINTITILLVIVLGTTASIGFIGPFFHNNPETFRKTSSFHMVDFRISLFMFFFILAGFDTLAKFMEETKDPADVSRSFFTSNIGSDILTLGIAMAIFYWIPHLSKANEEHAFANLVGHFLGDSATEVFKIVIVAFMIVTTFVVFLAISRYIYGLGEKKNIPILTPLNENKAPYMSIGILSLVAAFGILNNHTDTLVMISDLGLIVTILLVSAAATVADWNSGETLNSIISGLTTTGFGGFLSLYAMG